MPTPFPDDLYALSPKGLHRLRRYGVPYALLGLTYRQMAEQLGESRAVVLREMERLREELTRIAEEASGSSSRADISGDGDQAPR